jgi:ribose-phosphate pyrophosphokinase
MLLKKYLDAEQFDTELTIYYMPYSRMDRSENGSAFTLKYIADFINSLNFPDVEIIEPHSDVCMALINNSHARYITVDMLPDVKKAIGFREDFDFIFFPDAGAQKRYGSKIKAKWEIVGFKHRDFETGKITKLEIVGHLPENLRDVKILIVDDLCSKGGTFMLAAEELKNRGANEIYLMVGHCENTIHEGNVLCTDLIQGVYTTNSIISTDNYDRLNVYDIEKIERKQ